MKKAKLALGIAVAALAAAAVLATAQSSSATAATVCDGFLPPGTYGAVIVPRDAACFSEGLVMIGGPVIVEEGATFALGSEEDPGPLNTIGGGGVLAFHPASVQIHFTTIIGGINIQGGSGPFGGPFMITWNAIEDNKIIGTTTINGYNGFWQGFIRNHTMGSVNFTNNVVADPDGNEIVTNSIHGNLNCSGNDPSPQVGDSEGSPNLVYGFRTGQCAGL